ncbi:DUF3068 domain-containing protein [Spirillospora sp. NPDC047279]|uniref:DUF3068 domain-containing protein n=1 Tax=Spirillospora sp. NPDC047279 TaxID=3155478 RepID=UPI0034041C23
MRRNIGLLLVVLGAFFLALAPLVKFYVAEQLVVAPLNRYQRTSLEAPNATYFDMATLKLRQGVTLVAENTVRGDVRANAGNDAIAVWDSSTNIFDKAHPDKMIEVQGYRIAFDRRSSRLVDCCGTNIGGDTNVRMTGYGLLFPLANVEKKTYPFFDMTTRQEVPMRFEAVEEVQGVTAYKFTRQVPVTKTQKVDFKMPADWLGLSKKLPAQKIDRYFESTITQWVDPRTGVPIKVRQAIHSFVQTPDGKGKMTVAQADLRTTAAGEKSLISQADSSALQIAAVRTYVPLGSLFLGVILLLLGAIVGVLADRHAARAPKTPVRRSDGKFGEAAPPHASDQPVRHP